MLIVKSFVKGITPPGKLASASPFAIVALTTIEPVCPHGIGNIGGIGSGVSVVMVGDTDTIDHDMGALFVAFDGWTVARFSRLSTDPIGAVAGMPVISVTGTNAGAASTTTIHTAVCPPAVLTVIVAVPGATAITLNSSGFPDTGVTIAISGLLLVAVRVWFVAFAGKMTAVKTPVVADVGEAIPPGALKRSADGVRFTPVVPKTGSET
jgi:hypothetical protein